MSVDTRVNLIGYVEAEAIASWISDNIDKNVKLGEETVLNITRKEFLKYVESGELKEYYGTDRTLWSRGRWITFTYNGRQRTMFYHYSPLNWYENLKYYEPLGLADMVKSETTSLSLGQDEDAEYILERITKAFGGWIDYNDSDDEEYVKFEKGSDTPIKVKHITMEDVYKAFGGFVVIDK